MDDNDNFADLKVGHDLFEAHLVTVALEYVWVRREPILR